MSKTNYPELSNKHILIVDDIPANALIIDKFLKLTNARTKCLYSGQEALDYLFVMGKHPDAIMLDLKMPDVDGYKVLEAIRSNPKTADIVVIVVTAFTAEENLTRAMKLGANGYLSKPIRKEEIYDALSDYIPAAKSDQFPKVSEFCRKFFGSGYENSSHKRVYERLAGSFYLSPKKVFMLAHGRSPQTDLEQRAFQALVEEGVIQRNRPIRYK